MTLAALVVFMSFGCGTQEAIPSSAQPPKAGSNSVLIPEPFEEVWSRAIPQIGMSLFVINYSDKSSRILNVSYVGVPEKYVDCGTIHSEWGVNKADFPVANSRQQWIGPAGGLKAATFTQRVTLDGKMNIVFARVSIDSTRVTVNARYALKRRVIKEIVGGWSEPTEIDESAEFNTGGNASLGTAVCMPSGKLESEALKLISSVGAASSVK
jgi:hypothetical protein